MKLAFLYAGQGSQHAGMGADLYASSPVFRRVMDEAAAAVDFDLKTTCFEDPEGVINQTQYTQPCMVAFAAGVTAMLAEEGIRPEYAAGLSLGEYSALECAGVLDAKTAVELVAFRGKAMAKASEGLACGMTAVLALDRDRLQACCDEASALGVVQICNYNCPGQLVIGGRKPPSTARPNWQRKRAPSAACRSRSAGRSTPRSCTRRASPWPSVLRG